MEQLLMLVSSVKQPELKKAAAALECNGTCKCRMIAGGEMSWWLHSRKKSNWEN